ncbi:MAG: Hsp20/alpha crystallin family protein [Oligoflexia bacterium]|nr:Hsp20/alpha crystallin family protein [Oligoflexia bacterium]
MKSINLYRTRSLNPWNDFQREFDHLFYGGQTRSTESTYWSPKIDYYELEDKYLINMEIPGMPKDQIKIEFFDGVMTVSGEKNAEQKEANNFYSERSHGKFLRSFTLPKETDLEKVESSLEDGLLTIVIPKVEAKKPKELRVGENKGLLKKLLGESK